jgi:uncharacterized BrkB/YihY/UPF0761 family membrane protein
MFKNTLLLLGMIALILVLVVAGPVLVIWAGNELGQYLWPDRVIPYTIWTWLAVLIIGVFIRSEMVFAKKN